MIFEDTVKLLENTPNPFQLSKHMADITSGMRNLADRFGVVEQSRVDDMHRLQDLEIVTKAEKDEIGVVAHDRTTLQQQVAALEARIVAMETKVKDAPFAGTAVFNPDAPRYDASGNLIPASTPLDPNAKYFDKQGNPLPSTHVKYDREGRPITSPTTATQNGMFAAGGFVPKADLLPPLSQPLSSGSQV